MPGRITNLLLLLLLLAAPPALAQGTGAGAAVPTVEDALTRIAPQGDAPREWSLLRRGTDGLEAWVPLDVGAWVPGRLGERSHGALAAPELRAIRNSGLAHSPNEGSLWASRGPSTRVRWGAMARAGPLEVVVAPEVTWSRNRAFQTLSPDHPERHPFASPWHGPPHDSADLPLRPGAEPLLALHPGQTAIAVRGRGLRFGFGTENRWWGPGLANALVLGGNASGFPHAFLETARPHSTRLGEVEAAWIMGRLVASPWLQREGAPGGRTVTGLAFSLQPMDELRLGAARLVVRPLWGALTGILDPVVSWDRARPEAGKGPPESDQVFSLFFQLGPAERVEVYGEWARMDPPGGFREFLETPHHSQGYTLGFQWRSEAGDSGRSVRVHAEVTNLEQTRVRVDRPTPPPFYTGRATAEGLTHRGRVLGAAIGPGAQSQHLFVDFLGSAGSSIPGWRAGVLMGRIRWENDTFNRLPFMTFWSHDTSFLGGVRAAGEIRGTWVEGQVVYQKRLNYLFQNGTNRPMDLRTVDVPNWTLGVTVRPNGEMRR